MNSAHEICSRLGLPAPDEATAASWDELQRDYPGPPVFFTDAFVTECCRMLLIKDDIKEALRAAAAVCLGRDEISTWAGTGTSASPIGTLIRAFRRTGSSPTIGQNCSSR